MIRFGVLLILLALVMVNAHNDDGYYHDTKDLPANQDWMRKLPNTRRIRQLSIPGTHDSVNRFVAPKTEVDPSWPFKRLPNNELDACQTLTLTQQLNAGIRAFDIRLKLDKRWGGFAGDYDYSDYEGEIWSNLFFDKVLDDMIDFLFEHQSETILMRVREASNNQNPGVEFEQMFDEYFDWIRYEFFIYKPTNGAENPTLGLVRGKIVFLQDFNSKKVYGLSWTNFTKQDDYNVPDAINLYDKWLKIKTLSTIKPPTNGCINHLSGVGPNKWVSPYFVASGHTSPATNGSRAVTGRTTPQFNTLWPDFPRVDCVYINSQNICQIVYEGTNTLMKNHLNNVRSRYVGIVYADFPGTGLINEIINCNARFYV